MSHATPLITAAIVATSSLLLLAQASGANAGSAGAGTGTGASSGSAGASAPSGMGTGAGNAGATAPSGVGTKDTGASGNLGAGADPANPNVQPATPAKSRSAAQAARNAGAGRAPNGLPIGAIGSGTSNEDQKAAASASTRTNAPPAAQAQGNSVDTGRGSSLSNQNSVPRAARAGDKVLDAKAQVDRRTTVAPRRVPGL